MKLDNLLPRSKRVKTNTSYFSQKSQVQKWTQRANKLTYLKNSFFIWKNISMPTIQALNRIQDGFLWNVWHPIASKFFWNFQVWPPGLLRIGSLGYHILIFSFDLLNLSYMESTTFYRIQIDQPSVFLFISENGSYKSGSKRVTVQLRTAVCMGCQKVIF